MHQLCKEVPLQFQGKHFACPTYYSFHSSWYLGSTFCSLSVYQGAGIDLQARINTSFKCLSEAIGTTGNIVHDPAVASIGAHAQDFGFAESCTTLASKMGWGF